MKKIFLFAMAFAATTAWADTIDEPIVESIAEEEAVEFASDEHMEYGILNQLVSNTLAPAADAESVEYGRKVTKYASVPKFGGYFIGKYAYCTDEDLNANQGFSQRLIRAYVDGKILGDFAYRIQVQMNNQAFHMKDFFVEWQKYDEFRVKIGQFKRAFTLENPMNPWDVGVGDYSQLVKKLAGMGDDFTGEAASNGGRDQGLQIQGDLFKMNDGHKLLHYQVMVANGQGINTADANSHKDLLATIQIQPIKGLTIGAFGWYGDYAGKVSYGSNQSRVLTVDRHRWVASARYEKNDWTFRAEYGSSKGHILSDAKLNSQGELTGWKSENDKADAWYVTVGAPCTPWLKTYVKWDVYRKDATNDTMKSIYSVAPNFQLHKNLMFQLQYNYVDDKLVDKNYSEIWLQTYVRF